MASTCKESVYLSIYQAIYLSNIYIYVYIHLPYQMFTYAYMCMHSRPSWKYSPSVDRQSVPTVVSLHLVARTAASDTIWCLAGNEQIIPTEVSMTCNTPPVPYCAPEEYPLSRKNRSVIHQARRRCPHLMLRASCRLNDPASWSRHHSWFTLNADLWRKTSLRLHKGQGH